MKHVFFDVVRAGLSHQVRELASFRETKRAGRVRISGGRLNVLVHNVGYHVRKWIEFALVPDCAAYNSTGFRDAKHFAQRGVWVGKQHHAETADDDVK